ncbi:Pyruvate carboxyltransferase [Senna tora]|uniref:Pyruvate carboxyltransferase n=1 Tax=Senna tora TaxID=362788 RepID=A0A834TKL7_9FABA|nr:Pyruvate carboxyltransferase [Senna tora]
MNPNPREMGWVESSDSEPGEEIEEMRDLQHTENPRSPPPHRDARGPIGHVTVVGREDNRYVLHFERMEDLYYIHSEGPWSIHGALFHLIKWQPNMILSNVTITEVPLWIQLWGLHLDYQIPQVARRISQVAGEVMEVDWAPIMPRNIRFMRVRVMVPINRPLVMGLLLKLDNDIHVWIRFRDHRRSTHVVSYYMLEGVEYYPVNAPAVEFQFDTYAGVLNEQGNMVTE